MKIDKEKIENTILISICCILIFSLGRFLWGIPYRQLKCFFNTFTREYPILFMSIAIPIFIIFIVWALLDNYIFSESTKNKLKEKWFFFWFGALLFFSIFLTLFYIVRFFVIDNMLSLIYSIAIVIGLLILYPTLRPIYRIIKKEYDKKKTEEAEEEERIKEEVKKAQEERDRFANYKTATEIRRQEEEERERLTEYYKQLAKEKKDKLELP